MGFADHPGGVNLPVIYNVVKAVGPVGPNERDDVLLVQYCLRHIYFPHQEPPKGAITVDGWYGPLTGAYIKAFQKQANGKGFHVAQDGVVNRANGETSSISHTQYTIVALNKILKLVSAWNRIPVAVPLTPAGQVGSPYNPPRQEESGGY